MKRKISSIFLLVAFVSLMTHDLIPHHHHEDGNEAIVEYEHSHSNIESDNHANCSHESDHHEKPTCSSEKELKDDHQHDCPHHLHQCPSNLFEIVNHRSVKNSTKAKVLNSIFAKAFILSIIPKHTESSVFISWKTALPDFKVPGAITLRAPPSAA